MRVLEAATFLFLTVGAGSADDVCGQACERPLWPVFTEDERVSPEEPSYALVEELNIGTEGGDCYLVVSFPTDTVGMETYVDGDHVIKKLLWRGLDGSQEPITRAEALRRAETICFGGM